MPYTATFLVLAVLGLADTAYLFFQHRRKNPLVCPLNHDCAIVTESKWASIFGVRNDTLGLFYYAGLLVAMIAHVVQPDLIPNAYLIFLIGTGGGLCFSVFLVLLQIYVIKDYCFYCMVSAGVTGLLFVNSLALYFQG